MIILVVSPIILSAFVYNVNAYINGYLFSDILGRRGGDAAQIGILYAEYATYFMTIINIPLTLSSTATYFHDSGSFCIVCHRRY